MSKKIAMSKRAQRKKFPLLPITLAVGGLLLIIGAFFALRGNTSTSRTNIEVTGAPSLKVDKEQVDLGDVRLGQWVSATFQLTNVGDQTLRFTRPPFIEVREGC